jgi:SOS response regulatory protein OraA/RecX
MDDDRSYSYALWLLSRRNYTALKLKRKLLSKSFAKDEIDRSIQKLIAQGLLRERFYIEEKARLWTQRGYTPALIQQKLRVDGVSLPASQWHEIFQNLGIPKEEDSDQLQNLLQSEFRKLRRPLATDLEAKRKLEDKILRAAFRKGYSPSKARPLLKEIWKEGRN